MDLFISPALNVISDRLDPNGEWLKILQQQKYDLGLFSKLRRILLSLGVVLEDAENKQSWNQQVHQWLGKLGDAMEDAENILEEINYEALKLKVESQHGETSSQQVSDQFREEILTKVEETIENLEGLEGNIVRLGLLAYIGSSKQVNRNPQPPTIVDDDFLDYSDDVYGRKNEVEQLVSRVLLSVDFDEERLGVIPIVGMSGVGKTTLAGVVYNDPRVQAHFELKAWVRCSQQFDALSITKALLVEIMGPSASTTNGSLNQIQIKLKEQIRGKKFLFVLDNVTKERYSNWPYLKSPFVQGEFGSKLIVTTREDIGALMMDLMGDYQPIYLKTLSSEESWSLFQRHAFRNRKLREDPELQQVGKRIAEKCGGLPLSLKAIAGLLRPKSDIVEWESVLTSGAWEHSVTSSTSILPALALSYNDLPRHLKQCFAYCAVFPEHCTFDREYVVRLWTANGLVQQFQGDKTIDDIGNQIFHELYSRSLIEKQSNKFMMHDLVHDLAQVVSSYRCNSSDVLWGSHALQGARHLSFTPNNNNQEDLIIFGVPRELRTLLPIYSFNYYGDHFNKRVLKDMLPNLAFLRALSLSFCYKIAELPDNLFITLKQLRFLDLSFTYVHKLPDSICMLYNLQTLLLSHCRYLCKLPRKIDNLISLRYLDIRGTPLETPLLPPRIECNDTRVEELGDFHDFHGLSSISKLQNVDDGRDVMKAKLGYKEYVEKLSLQWSPVDADDSRVGRDILNKLWSSTAELKIDGFQRTKFSGWLGDQSFCKSPMDDGDSHTERDILNKLCPSTNIKDIEIIGYRGTKFPNWLGDESFCDLVKLSLHNCNNCDSLPALGQLPNLKFLSIRGMREISIVTEEFYGNEQFIKEPFQSLVELAFADMPEWKVWHVSESTVFPKLEHLSIHDCPNLIVDLPKGLYALIKLSIRTDSDSFHNLRRLSVPSGIQELEISECKNLKSAVMSLHKLKIIYCKSQMAFPQGGLAAPNLKELEFTCCFTLKSLPEHMRHLFPSLEKLMISDCPEIESFPVGGLPVSLETLVICDCKKLVNGRKEWRLQELPSLKYLTIHHDGSDEVIESWELPCTVEQLYLTNLRTLNYKTLESLTSLETLHMYEFPNIQSLLSEGVLLCLTYLQSLYISYCNQLQCLPERGIPSSLSRLYINSCHGLQSLPERGLPSSLDELCIYDCPQLHSLPQKGLPSSLSELCISNCPQLRSLLENGLPSSITRLSISGCPLLKSRLEFEKGVDWPRIAHIPTIWIDGELM